LSSSATIARPRPSLAGQAPSTDEDGGLKVFILGSPRSGTSITYHAMREVFALPGRGESHVIPVFQRILHLFYNYALEFSAMDGVLARNLDTASFKRFLAGYVREFYGQQYEGGCWVDKTPGAEAILGAELVAQVFPNAKFLLLRRNGIEIVQSAQKKFDMSFSDACRGWATCMEAAESLRARRLDLLELDQFELTNTPEESAARIAAFLACPDKEAELAAFFRDQRVDKTSDHDWTRRVTLDDVDWNKAQKVEFLDLCGEAMLRAGYPLSREG
jgi:hypothetical protein